MKLLVVESPAKQKTIEKYLGKDFEITASFGHMRSIPSVKGAVRPDKNFEVDYELTQQGKKYLSSLTYKAKNSEAIYLATDPDREGEAIAWHILELLKKNNALVKDVKIYRVVFHEITKKAVQSAVAGPRELNFDLISAQLARQALDYLVGFTLSPVLWKKLPGSRSAGRVQSVALRLICDCEQEIEKFVAQEYWTIDVDFITENKEQLSAKLSSYKGKNLDKFDIPTKEHADEIFDALSNNDFSIASIKRKKQKRNPYAPFITSTLQQDAINKLGMSGKQVMSVAQKLYEGDVGGTGEKTGFITYMRTDSTNLSNDALASIRKFISNEYGAEYLPKTVRSFDKKVKNAQEAHEAIRPTDIMCTPSSLNGILDGVQLKLYDLIWRRTVACQMEQVIFDCVSIDIVDQTNSMFHATGSVIAFDGFYKVYKASDSDSDKLLPNVSEGEKCKISEMLPVQHFTQPPARYTEATIVKKMEEIGIGRPSTYASIISVIQEREYVSLVKKRFKPEIRGRIVVAFLIDFFQQYVDYDFTAQMEEQLDDVSSGKMEWKALLRKFWDDFIKIIKETDKYSIADVIEKLDPHIDYFLFPMEDSKINKKCPLCKENDLQIRFGKFGPFLGCMNYPECKHVKNFYDSSDSANSEDLHDTQYPIELGEDEDTGEKIYIKKGPYGLYVQRGVREKSSTKGTNKKSEEKDSVRNISSVPKGIDAAEVDVEMAKKILSLPLILGQNPETKLDIKIGEGKYGSYILYDKKFTSIPVGEKLFDVTLEHALELIKSAPQKSKAESKLTILGKYPDTDNDIKIGVGRYGPYILYKSVFITIPNTDDIDNVVLERAIELITESPKVKVNSKKNSNSTTAKTKKASVKKSTKKK